MSFLAALAFAFPDNAWADPSPPCLLVRSLIQILLICSSVPPASSDFFLGVDFVADYI